MLSAFILTYLFAFLSLISASPTRDVNGGTLSFPPDGYHVQASTALNIAYVFYNGGGEHTERINVGFEVFPDTGRHLTYFSADILGMPGTETKASVIVPDSAGTYKLIVTDRRSPGLFKRLYSEVTVNQTIIVTAKG